MPKVKKTVFSSLPSVDQIQPTAGYLLVKPADSQKQTASGLYLPDNKEEQPQYGDVLAVGGAFTDHGVEVLSPAQVGDRVVYKKWGGNELKIEDVDYQLLKFEDILAIIK